MDERLVNLAVLEPRSEAEPLASKLRAYGLFVHVAAPIPVLPQWRAVPVQVRAGDYETARALVGDGPAPAPQALGPVARNVPAIGVLTCAAAMALIVRARLRAGSEDLSGVFIGLSVAYPVMVSEAIRTRRQWWTLLTAPVALLFIAQLFAL